MSASKPPFEIGLRFGDWEVVAQLEEPVAGTKQGRVLLSRVRCVCGTEKVLRNNYLRAGRSNGCGCRRTRAFAASSRSHGKSRTANYRLWASIKHRLKTQSAYQSVRMHPEWVEKFDAFDAFIKSLGPKPTPQHTLDRIRPSGHYEPGNLRWATKQTQTDNRRPFRGYKRGAPIYHGRTRTPIYTLWRGIKQRLREQQGSYVGIRMHEGWVHNFPAFEKFIKSLGPKPTPQHTLDRIEPDGHYEPGNLRWADKKTQSENRRNNKHRQVLTKSLVVVGEKYGMLTVLALVIEERHGVTWYCAEVECECTTKKVVYQKQLVNGRTKSCGCFKNRNIRLGHKALEKPIEANGRTMSMAAWARETGISKHVIWNRIHVCGWDPARAVTESRREGATVEVNGEILTLGQWAKRHGVPTRAIRKRLELGWEPSAAVTTPVRSWGANRA